MNSRVFLLAFVTSICVEFVHTCDPNGQPVIGILAQSLNEPNYPNTNYLAASYVKFVEMFGGRVVPILPNKDGSYYQFLAEHLNGVLFPGGGVDLYSGSYHDMAKFFYEYSLSLANNSSQNFPILGICLGFEELSTLAAKGANVMSNTNSSNQLSNMELTKYGKEDSEVLNSAPDWLITAMETADLAPNFHHFSLLKTTYEAHADIQDIFNVVSYGYDKQNVKFVAIMESKKYPFLAVQHHPEKNLFEWDSGLNLAHNFLGSAYSQFIGDYFVQLCRTSCQRFGSEDQLDQYLIYNYPVTYSQNLFDNKHFTEMYLFPEDSGSL